jgi:hypothetical protein
VECGRAARIGVPVRVADEAELISKYAQVALPRRDVTAVTDVSSAVDTTAEQNCCSFGNGDH